MSLSKCSEDAITSFPLYLAANYRPTAAEYDAIKQDVELDAQFASRTGAPTFSTGGVLDEGTGVYSVSSTNSGSQQGSSAGSSPSLSSNDTTLKLNNNTYVLYSVQIAKATHTQWLPGVDPTTNKEDVLVVFKSKNDKGKIAYVIFVIPLLRVPTATTTNYLSALSTGSLVPGISSISLKELFHNTPYIYYITCLDGYSELAPTQDVCTFVAVQGINVFDSMMNNIIQKIPGGVTPDRVLPYSARLAPHIKTMIAKEDLSTYVVSTNTLFSRPGTANTFLGGARSQVVELINTASDPVKCTVLNPDTDIDENGIIRADIESGEILKNVLEQRNAVVQGVTSVGGQSIQSRKNVERITSYIISTILSLLLIGVIVYVAASNIPSQAVATPTAAPTIPWYSVTPWWVYLVVVSLCLLCYLIGAIL